MTNTHTRRVIATTLLVVAIAVAWRLMGPIQLGGTAAYVITHGISMEPKYHEGDLVILRKSGAYAEGDIVGFHSTSLDRTILHRIHHLEEGAIVTKGDNNGWLDSDRPSSADVLGKAWLHLPGVGKWLAKTRSPVVATTLIGLVVLSFFLGNEKRRRRGKKGKGFGLPRISLSSFTDQQKTWLAVPAGFLLVFLLLGVIGFSKPVVAAVAGDAAFEHVGDFSFFADVPKSPVYPTGQVEPGRPIFRRVVDKLEVQFDYRLTSDLARSIEGEALMVARVSGATGWKKAFPVTKARAFKGNSVTLKGELDLNRIEQLSSRIQTITGLPEAAQKIELVPRIDVKGVVGGTKIAERFTPALEFGMDPHQLRVVTPSSGEAAPGEPVEDLRQTKPGEVPISETEANNLTVLGMSFEIRSVRTLSLLGMLLSLLALAGAWFRFSNPAHTDAASLIQAQYGDWLIPVESMDRSGTKLVQIKSIESLVRLAEVYERMILHDDGPEGHSYFLEEDGVVYCYRTATEKPSSPPEQPSKTRKSAGRQSREERRKVQAEKLRKEIDEIKEVLRAGRSEQ